MYTCQCLAFGLPDTRGPKWPNIYMGNPVGPILKGNYPGPARQECRAGRSTGNSTHALRACRQSPHLVACMPPGRELVQPRMHGLAAYFFAQLRMFVCVSCPCVQDDIPRALQGPQSRSRPPAIGAGQGLVDPSRFQRCCILPGGNSIWGIIFLHCLLIGTCTRAFLCRERSPIFLSSALSSSC